jgi:hypothetical protein
MPDDVRFAPAERLVAPDREGMDGPISRRSLWTPRTLEAYLRAGGRPRWMERIGEIDGGVAAAELRLGRAYRRLRAECGKDGLAFARRWRAFAERYDFADLNTLIDQHNDWYPMERDLPMDPRTGDYVLIRGRSYRRRRLDAAWILDRFPA